MAIVKPNWGITATRAGREARALLVGGIAGKPTSMFTPEMRALEDIYHSALRGEATEAELAAAIAKAKTIP